MHIHRVDYDKISALSYKDVTYQNHPEKLKEFIQFSPDIDGLDAAIRSRDQYPVDRDLLVRVLQDQYRDVPVSDLVQQNIASLRSEHTYTIITAHQPLNLGGPAYYFYKICSIIHLTQKLKARHPDKNFVPVYISGSEDHDFDEVKNIHLYGKTVTWETSELGPVGRFSMDGMDEVISTFGDIIGNGEHAQRIKNILNNARAHSTQYNQFVFRWLHEIFGKYGVVIAIMDQVDFKRRFASVMEKEIFERPSESLIQQTQDRLSTIDFKAQAFAREINLFYLQPQSRERIILEEDGSYTINNSDLRFTADELRAELHSHPDRFSPNVVMRPLYQEYMWPNLAYVGGGGEIAYWLERKAQFDHYGIFYPTLIRRTSASMVQKGLQKSMDKLSLSLEDILMDEDALINAYISRNNESALDVASVYSDLEKAFVTLAEKAKSVDPTLESAILTEQGKTIKLVEGLEGRIRRAIKSREEVSVNQIRTLKSKLFPNYGIQERHESAWSTIATEGFGIIDTWIAEMDPLDRGFMFMYL
jgi:bacillithiol synthase